MSNSYWFGSICVIIQMMAHREWHWRNGGIDYVGWFCVWLVAFLAWIVLGLINYYDK